MIRYKDWTEMSEKAANTQRKTLKDLQKAWGNIAQESLASQKQNLQRYEVCFKTFAQYCMTLQHSGLLVCVCQFDLLRYAFGGRQSVQ